MSTQYLDLNVRQNMAKPPTSLPPTTTAPLKVELLLGSFVHDPAKIELFDLYLPASHAPAPHPDEATFHLLPTIEHTFRAAEKLPPRPVSAFFAAIVVAPWVVLAGLVSHTSMSGLYLANEHFHSGSPSPLAFPTYSHLKFFRLPPYWRRSSFCSSGIGSS